MFGWISALFARSCLIYFSLEQLALVCSRFPQFSTQEIESGTAKRKPLRTVANWFLIFGVFDI
jgi:hypothetical protein